MNDPHDAPFAFSNSPMLGPAKSTCVRDGEEHVSGPPSMFGTSTDGANHNYDIHDFFDAMNAGNLPAVSFLKAPAFQDGHAGYSDPLLEQTFIVARSSLSNPSRAPASILESISGSTLTN